jgi:protein-S-isoprenylcysteine O-methyltransferase Ste14
MLKVGNTFEVIFLGGLVAGSVIRKLYTSKCMKSKAESKHSSMLDTALIVAAGLGMAAPLVYLFTPWLDFANYDLPGWMGWVGTAAFAAALVLLWRSHADLGLNWSATLQIKSGHSLVTHGVYRRIRHPMYAAHMLWAVAQGLLLENWLAGWVFVVTFIPLYLLRVPREERMMLERFGQEYRTYMARTGRMIPRFWR